MVERSPKSVHITNYYHKDSGGISTFYNKLLEAANRHHRYVRLIVPGENSTVEEVGDFGRIYYVKAFKSPVIDNRYRLLTPLNYLQTGTPIREILTAEKPDIIEIGEKYLLSLLAGVIRTGHFKEVGRPVLIHFSHERMDDNLRAFVSKGKFFNWFSRQLVRNYILPMFDYHIANSNYTAGELTAGLTPSPSPLSYAEVFSNFCSRKLNAGALRSTGDVKVSNCGADFQFYNSYQRNDKVRRQLLIDAGFPEDARVILYAGRISPEKNISLIPTIFQLLQGSDLCSANQGKYRLLILGSGPLSDWLEDELNRLTPGQFKMMGHLADKTKLAEVYANSDAFFHPNPCEPFGIGPLEAMAANLPVVLPNTGGVMSYASSDNAWLVGPAPEQYVTAIQEILCNDAERTRRTENAVTTARDNSWGLATDRLFALYDEMIAEFEERNGEQSEDADRPIIRTFSDQASDRIVR